MKNTISTFDLTVSSLCYQIDELKEQVEFWRNKYEEEQRLNAQMSEDSSRKAQQGAAFALAFALSTREDGKGNLIIEKQERETLYEFTSKA